MLKERFRCLMHNLLDIGFVTDASPSRISFPAFYYQDLAR